MFLVNNQKKPTAKYRTVTSYIRAGDVNEGVERALQLLEIKVNDISEGFITADKKLAITLNGSPSITVTPFKNGVIMYEVTASQSMLIEVVD